MKKNFSLVLTVVVILLITLTGCGKKEEVNNNASVSDASNQASAPSDVLSTRNNEFDNSKIKKYYVDKIGTDNYYMKMKASFEGADATIESSKKGNKIASYIVEQNVTTLVDNDITYTIDHNEKMIYKISSQVSTSELVPTAEEIFNEETMQITSGKDTLNGKEYDYEEMDGTRYYFLNDEVKFIKVDGEIIEILEISKTPKDSLFEKPSDYTEMSI